jgi:hypothetical protein
MSATSKPKKVVAKKAPTYALPSVPFQYKDELYLRMVPSKRLFNSTTIWEVVNRGDFFAVSLKTGVFTVVPGDYANPVQKELVL